jgi:hypothetical protein
VDFAEEEVDDDGEDPEEEIVYDVIVCLLAFVGHGGRGCCSCRALSGVCLACILGARWSRSRVRTRVVACVVLLSMKNTRSDRCSEVAASDKAKSGQTE